MTRRRGRAWVRWTLLGATVVSLLLATTAVGLLLALSLWARPSLPRAKVALSRAQGEAFAVALERYLADRGSCPPTLQDLVPYYLTRIPAMSGREWEYTRGPDGRSWQISFIQESTEHWLASDHPSDWRVRPR
jgi:hypothetical protein